MKHTRIILASSLVVAFVAALVAQTSSKPAAQAVADLPDAPSATVAAAIRPNGPTVVFETSMGNISCQFYQKQTPHAVANFIALAEGSMDWTDPATKQKRHNKPFFDGTTFHRVIPEFMIQGGDPSGTGLGDPGFHFADEIVPDLNFDRPGRLAMANSGPDTNGSQFFITEVPYESLNQHYTLIGQCDDAGIEVVRSITRVERDGADKPLTPVILKKVTIHREGQRPPSATNSAPKP